MNTIRMLRDFPVAPNGIDTTTWAKGSVHEDVSDQLAGDLVDAGLAELVDPEPEPEKDPGEGGKKGKA